MFLPSVISRKTHLPAFSLLLFIGMGSAADDPRLEARNRAREAAAQSAGIDRVLSKEMPDEIKALPILGEIEWTMNALPFVDKGPHAGISGAGMVAVDGKIYLSGGFIPAGDETDDPGRRTSRWSYRYTPETAQWIQLPNLPARREYTRSIAGDKAVYLLGGMIQGKPHKSNADVFRLDTIKKQWGVFASLNIPRTHASVGKIGNRLLVAGGNNYEFEKRGYDESTILNSLEVFDLNEPEKAWVEKTSIPGIPRGWCATSVVNGEFYLLGGVTFIGSGTKNRAARRRLQEVIRYNPEKDKWTRLADFPIQISGWEGETYKDRYIIVVGGAGSRWNDVPYVFDTKDNRWFRMTSTVPPGGFYNDPGVCIIGDTIYVAGGEGAGGSHFNHFLIGKIKLP